MKKILIPAIAMLALTGCQKAEPAKEPAAEGLDTITATIDDQTKAHLEGLKGYWDANDQITLSPQSATAAAGAIFTTEAGGASATFTGTFPETLTNGKYCAFYPVSALPNGENQVWNPGGGDPCKINVKLPQSQTVSEIADGVYMDPSVLWLGGYSTSQSIHFEPLLSYIKFEFPANAEYKLKKVRLATSGIIISTNNTAAVSYDAESAKWTYEFSGSNASVYIQNTDGFAPGTYYIGFRPLANPTDPSKTYNVTIALTKVGGSDGKLYSKTIEGINTKAGTIYNLGTLPTSFQ